jgi:thioredoxin reductase
MGNPMERVDEYHEYIIVGAGPAGVQAAYYLQKAGRDYVVLERGDKPGYFFERFPRHRTLISINKRFNYFPEDDYNLRHDWNSLLSDDPEMRFTKYSDQLFPSADKLLEYIADYCNKFNINICFNTNVEKIGRKTNKDGVTEFWLRCQGGTNYKCQVLIMATGAMKEKLPNIPGIELATRYSEHSTNQADYENKKVAIIGGGNSGFETADHLSGHAAIIHMHSDNGYKLAWDSHFPGDLRAINNSIIDMFHLKSIHGLRKAVPTKIEEVDVDGKRQLKMYFDQHLPHWEPPCTAHLHDTYDSIIFCTGWYYVIPEMWDESCKPETSECGKYPSQKPTWESTNIDNLFFAGTSTQGRDRRAASSFIHGFRYSAKCLALMLNMVRHGEPMPQEHFDTIDMDAIAMHITKRLSTSSALYQLNYGVLCDLLVFNPGEEMKGKSFSEGMKIKGSAKYFYEIPTEWALSQNLFKNQENLWVVILKDGKSSYPQWQTALDFTVPPRMMDFDLPCQGFIQPIIRRYHFGKLVSETALGGNFVVRLDQHQLSGDSNPQRSLNKLKKLMCDQLGMNSDCIVDVMYPKDVFQKRFTPWTKEEIEEHKMQEQEKFSTKPCRYGIDPPKWQRKGNELQLEVIDH